MKRLLNLGCGSRYRTGNGWTNVDFNGIPGCVIAHDLTRGIPFPDGTFEVVYHSHVLEHLSIEDAAQLLRECLRVLRPGGICRVAVPDLERICRQYLDTLERVLIGEAQSEGCYRWMGFELLDQLVRHRTGGQMGAYLKWTDAPQRAFIVSRIGNVAQLPASLGTAKQPQQPPVRAAQLQRAWRFASRKLTAFRRAVVSIGLSRRERQALAVGMFRLRGEVHLWMYDRYSLSQILREAGFDGIEQCSATNSRISGWVEQCLDTHQDGSTYKPDSLFMEGLRLK